MESVYLAIPLASLVGAVIAGFLGGGIGRKGAHTATILGVGTSFVLSLYVLYQHVFGGVENYNGTVSPGWFPRVSASKSGFLSTTLL